MNSQVNTASASALPAEGPLVFVHVLPPAGRAFDTGSHTEPDFHRQATTKLRTCCAGRTNSQG
jgi:hypothetical protein